MSYKQIKWLILAIPTLTIGVWEYVRHQFLLPYLSMEVGNWLAPVLVFMVTMIFLTQLFSMLEDMQEELKKARATRAALEEREKLARELHDGIAQSLFLLAVKVDQLDKQRAGESSDIQGFRQTVHEVNGYVRQAIANLRYPATTESLPWIDLMNSLATDLSEETGLHVDWNWRLEEGRLSAKEKVELYASVREAFQNIRKHAQADQVWVSAMPNGEGWIINVEDNGIGLVGEPLVRETSFGLKILKERAEEMNWKFDLFREKGRTVWCLRKEASS